MIAESFFTQMVEYLFRDETADPDTLESADDEWESDCITEPLIGKHEAFTDNALPRYNKSKQRINQVFGVLHAILLLITLSYMCFSRFTGHRLSRLQWIYLVSLSIILTLITWVDFGYFGLGEGDAKNCGYYDHIFFGSCDIMLFILSILLGFK